MSTTSAAREAGSSAATEAWPGPRVVLLWSAWFGIVAGFLELGAFLAKCNLLDTRNYNTSRHFVWMYPVAGLAIVGVPGSLLAVASLVRRGRVPSSLVIGVLAFVAALGVVFRAPISTVACLLLAGGIGAQLGRYLGARSATFHRCVRRSLPVLLVLLAATAAVSFGRGIGQYARGGSPRPPSGSKNVLLIVLDTVRADSLSLYGYPRETTPNLTRIAARGVRFDRAFATAPWTAPSHASMFTGRWAHELSVGWNSPLDATTPTLAEFFAARGYDTAGFVANTTYCSHETGLDRGFARYDDYDVTPRSVLLCSAVVQRVVNFLGTHPRLTHVLGGGGSSSPFRKSAARINGDFLAWESGRGGVDRPFFAFLNYYDAHHPYLTPEPWEGGPPGRRPESADDFGLLRSWWGLDKRRLDQRQVELARDSYDRCIAYLDAQIGRLHDELDRRGLLRDTIVVVTADHGEHLGEQRLFGHGVSLYSKELHVPLIVLGPDGVIPRGQVVRTPVSLRDLAATVADRSGVAPETSPFPGRSLARAWSGAPARDAMTELVRSEVQAPPEDDPNRGRSPVQRGPMTSLVAGTLHYIRNGDGREELYDLDSDSAEEHDLAAAPGSARALRGFRDRLP